MKKKWEVRYFVTAVASIPVYKAYSKTETYRQAAKDGWGTVYRDENNALVCDLSINAPLTGGDYFLRSCIRNISPFNQRPPHGGRPTDGDHRRTV